MSKNNNKGFSLVGVVIAIFVLLIMGVYAISLLNTRAGSSENNMTVQEAQTRAEEALSALSAIGPDLPIGGSFGVLDDNKLKMTACSDQTCDFVLLPDVPENQRLSFAKGFPYSSAVPDGSQKFFLRRWRVDEVDGNYNLRKITVAILKDEITNEPIVLEETTIGINR